MSDPVHHTKHSRGQQFCSSSLPFLDLGEHAYIKAILIRLGTPDFFVPELVLVLESADVCWNVNI